MMGMQMTMTRRRSQADASCKGFLDGVKLKNSAWASRSVPWKLRRKGMIRAAALFENHGITTVTNYWHMQEMDSEDVEDGVAVRGQMGSS
eukprot:3677286-Rhodomonas_salina.4